MKGKSQIQLQNISLDVVILDVLNLDQDESIFEVFFSMQLQWYDQGLHYEFLRQHTGNPVKNISNIWKPNLKFYHIVKEDLIEKVINIVLFSIETFFQAKKAENRFRVRQGTKFYRVKCKHYDR